MGMKRKSQVRREVEGSNLCLAAVSQKIKKVTQKKKILWNHLQSRVLMGKSMLQKREKRRKAEKRNQRRRRMIAPALTAQNLLHLQRMKTQVQMMRSKKERERGNGRLRQRKARRTKRRKTI